MHTTTTMLIRQYFGTKGASSSSTMRNLRTDSAKMPLFMHITKLVTMCMRWPDRLSEPPEHTPETYTSSVEDVCIQPLKLLLSIVVCDAVQRCYTWSILSMEQLSYWEVMKDQRLLFDCHPTLFSRVTPVPKLEVTALFLASCLESVPRVKRISKWI